MKTTLQLFSNPLGSKVEEQDHDLQMELCELQSDLFLASKSNNLQYEEFWKLLTNEQFPKLRKYSLKVCPMFGSTYICECTFSTMKMLKTKQRNRLSEDVLRSTLRLTTTKIEVDIPSLVKEHSAQCWH
jgi:hypothetical protein